MEASQATRGVWGWCAQIGNIPRIFLNFTRKCMCTFWCFLASFRGKTLALKFRPSSLPEIDASVCHRLQYYACMGQVWRVTDRPITAQSALQWLVQPNSRDSDVLLCFKSIRHFSQQTGKLLNLLPTCYATRRTILTFLGKTCYGTVANLLRSCYRETGLVNFGLYTTRGYGQKRQKK